MSDNVINLEEAVKAVNAESTSRTARWFNRLGALLGVSQEGKRDVYDIYGYPRDLDGENGFWRMYQYALRQGVANRITFGVAKPCWRDGFRIMEDPEDEQSVQLEDELTALGRRGLFSALERADILNRIGRFSVLLVGVPDGRTLDQPIGRAVGNAIEATYFRAYAYDQVEILEYEKDTSNPRYDLPVMYQITRSARRNTEKDRSAMRSFRVHYSRIAHLAENALDSQIEGTGALEPIFNRILDLEKATGGAAEAYFRNARGKIGYEIDPEFAASFLGDPTAREKFDEGAQKFTNEWQDHTVAAGSNIKPLPTPHYTPLDTVRASLWEVSSYSGIPLRVLTGEGAGQLAGSEDQLAFNQIIADRQRIFCMPQVSGTLSILSAASVIDYDPMWQIVFPQQRAATEAQQSETDNRKADTLSKVVSAVSQPGGDEIVLESALQAVGLSEIEIEDDPFGEEMEDDNV